MAKILDGKKLSDSLALGLAKEISAMSVLKIKPKLVIIQIGDREESNTYIKNKKLFGERIGAVVEHKKYLADISQKKLITDIVKYNSDSSVHGIIVQLPISAYLDTSSVIEAITPNKDVDGMTSKNIKLLFENKENFVPATTKGILALLDGYKINPAGMKVIIVGHSILVGKPTALAMLNRNATVTVCHSQTKNLREETRRADMIIVAVGHPKLITKNHVTKGQIVIDIGINFLPQNIKISQKGKIGAVLVSNLVPKKIVGDVDFENVKNIVRAITPVPGGVGPMTIVSLFQNLISACRNQN